MRHIYIVARKQNIRMRSQRNHYQRFETTHVRSGKINRVGNWQTCGVIAEQTEMCSDYDKLLR